MAQQALVQKYKDEGKGQEAGLYLIRVIDRALRCKARYMRRPSNRCDLPYLAFSEIIQLEQIGLHLPESFPDFIDIDP